MGIDLGINDSTYMSAELPPSPFLSGSSQLDEERWSEIVQDILSGNAIIFLGPGATVNFGDSDVQTRFFQKLAAENPNRVADFHEKDGFLVFHPRGRNRLSSKISDFFQQVGPNPLLDLLVELPFHIYITLSPDLALNKVFDQRGFDYEFAFNDRAPARELPWPSAQCPLLYSLLGSAAEGKESSLVVSHGDLFDLIESIHLRDSLPESLLSALSVQPDSSKTVLFLGIDYDRWYFHFLIHLFRMSGELSPIAAAGELPEAYERALYEAHFKVTFIQDGLLDFVKELTRRMPPARFRSEGQTGCRELEGILLECLDDLEISRLCQLHFPDVYREFTAGQSKSQRLRLLINHVHAHEECARLKALAHDMNPAYFESLQTGHGK